ncbi:MAG: hypothetical protein RIM33_17700 [Alphaproteobacteria bacterium]
MKKLMTMVGAAVLSTIILGAAAPAVQAEETLRICGPRDRIVDRLAASYQEQQTFTGMTVGGSLVELFLSPEGSWTFLHTTADGLSCLLAAGNDWEAAIQTEEDEASAS